MPAPKNVKQPSDRKPKAATAGADVTGGGKKVEFNGHTYTVDPDALDDWEFTELMAESRTSNDAKVAVGVVMIKALLGTDPESDGEDGKPLPSQYERWKTEQRASHGGRLPNGVAEKFLEAVGLGN